MKPHRITFTLLLCVASAGLPAATARATTGFVYADGYVDPWTATAATVCVHGAVDDGVNLAGVWTLTYVGLGGVVIEAPTKRTGATFPLTCRTFTTLGEGTLSAHLIFAGLGTADVSGELTVTADWNPVTGHGVTVVGTGR